MKNRWPNNTYNNSGSDAGLLENVLLFSIFIVGIWDEQENGLLFAILHNDDSNHKLLKAEIHKVGASGPFAIMSSSVERA